MVRNVGPTVRHVGRNDDDVARLDNALDDIRTGNHPTAGWPIEHLGHIALRSGCPAVYDLTAGDKSPTSRNDDVGLSLMIMRNAAGRCIGRWRGCLRTAGLSLGRGPAFPACGAATRRRCTGFAAMNDTYRLIQLADIDTDDLMIDTPSRVHGFNLLVSDIRRGFRRLRPHS